MVRVSVRVYDGQRKTGQRFRNRTHIFITVHGVDNQRFFCAGNQVAGAFVVVIQQPDVVINRNDFNTFKHKFPRFLIIIKIPAASRSQ